MSGAATDILCGRLEVGACCIAETRQIISGVTCMQQQGWGAWKPSVQGRPPQGNTISMEAQMQESVLPSGGEAQSPGGERPRSFEAMCIWVLDLVTISSRPFFPPQQNGGFTVGEDARSSLPLMDSKQSRPLEREKDAEREIRRQSQLVASSFPCLPSLS